MTCPVNQQNAIIIYEFIKFINCPDCRLHTLSTNYLFDKFDMETDNIYKVIKRTAKLIFYCRYKYGYEIHKTKITLYLCKLHQSLINDKEF